jgi:nicotinamidase-related amidase
MEWPIPDHFDPADVAKVRRVPYLERAAGAAAWAAENDVRAAASDARTVALLLVDVQNTFCLPEFELFVAGRSGRGAVEDNVRLCSFLYRNLGRITQVIATLDTHTPMQIFHPVFWVDADGRHPAPHTVVSVADVESGRWRINPALATTLGWNRGELDRFARHYVNELHAGGKYPLTIWPYHALLGGIGHALVGSVEEAVFFHSVARSSPARFETKGNHPLTENYSALRPEVLTDHTGRPLAQVNARLVDELLAFDAIVVAGQAKSHCVAWTVADLADEIRRRDLRLAGRVFLLEDCTSPVVVPGVVDFSESADAAYARFADDGMRLVRSSEPMESWPGFAEAVAAT